MNFLYAALLVSLLCASRAAVKLSYGRQVGRLVGVGLILTCLLMAAGTGELLTGGDSVAKTKKPSGTVASLTKQADEAIVAADWPTAFAVCNALRDRKGEEPKQLAHRLRGKVYECQDKLEEAEVEYQAAYSNGVGEHAHVASVSLMRVKRKLKARGT